MTAQSQSILSPAARQTPPPETGQLLGDKNQKFFKQYGEERSGTNILKQLVEMNFVDAIVFGSVLGWKHGLYQLTNGHSSPSANSHQDWVKRRCVNGTVHSVDNRPLPFDEPTLLRAAMSLVYLVSYKPLLPWLVSVKRFRFPRRDYSEKLVTSLLVRYIEAYKIWTRLPNALIVHHDLLLKSATCHALLQNLQTRYGLQLRNERMLVETRVIKASTDHGLLVSENAFDPHYYISRAYLDDLPDWVIRLTQLPYFDTQFIDYAARLSSRDLLAPPPVACSLT